MMAETEVALKIEGMETAKIEGLEAAAAEEMEEDEAAAKCKGVELLEPTELYNILNNNQV